MTPLCMTSMWMTLSPHGCVTLAVQPRCSQELSEYVPHFPLSCLPRQASIWRRPSNRCPLDRTSSPCGGRLYVCLGIPIRVLEKLRKESKANGNLFSWEVLVIRSYLGQCVEETLITWKNIVWFIDEEERTMTWVFSEVKKKKHSV